MPNESESNRRLFLATAAAGVGTTVLAQNAAAQEATRISEAQYELASLIERSTADLYPLGPIGIKSFVPKDAAHEPVEPYKREQLAKKETYELKLPENKRAKIHVQFSAWWENAIEVFEGNRAIAFRNNYYNVQPIEIGPSPNERTLLIAAIHKHSPPNHREAWFQSWQKVFEDNETYKHVGYDDSTPDRDHFLNAQAHVHIY